METLKSKEIEQMSVSPRLPLTKIRTACQDHLAGKMCRKMFFPKDIAK